MSCFSKFKSLSVTFLILLVMTVAGKAQSNVRVISNEASIYAEPNVHSLLNISAQKGDIFQVEEIREDWVQIHMFSGAARYIKGDNVEVTYERSFDSTDPATLAKFCGEIERAQSKASEEATEKHDQDLSRQGHYEQLLFDKYALNTFRAFDVPTYNTSKLIECVDDNLF